MIRLIECFRYLSSFRERALLLIRRAIFVSFRHRFRVPVRNEEASKRSAEFASGCAAVRTVGAVQIS